MAYEKVKEEVDYEQYEGLDVLRQTIQAKRDPEAVNSELHSCLQWEFDKANRSDLLLHSVEKLAGFGTYGYDDDAPTSFHANRLQNKTSAYYYELMITDQLGEGDVRLPLHTTVDVRFLGTSTEEANLEELNHRVVTMGESVAKTRRHYADRLEAAQAAQDV